MTDALHLPMMRGEEREEERSDKVKKTNEPIEGTRGREGGVRRKKSACWEGGNRRGVAALARPRAGSSSSCFRDRGDRERRARGRARRGERTEERAGKRERQGPRSRAARAGQGEARRAHGREQGRERGRGRERFVVRRRRGPRVRGAQIGSARRGAARSISRLDLRFLPCAGLWPVSRWELEFHVG